MLKAIKAFPKEKKKTSSQDEEMAHILEDFLYMYTRGPVPGLYPLIVGSL